MIERVRAILVTDDERLLVIKRTRPGVPTYWVLPGGHVEPDDADLESALHRELREELAGEAEIHALIQVLDADDGSDRQYFYLARIHTWRFDERTGPEFTDSAPARGTYELDEILLTPDAVSAINLKPSPIAELIHRAVAGPGLFALADLRPSPAGGPTGEPSA
jgi:8-oxo-dGTP pyrophosphatase MutT (NUDIX family)